MSQMHAVGVITDNTRSRAEKICEHNGTGHTARSWQFPAPGMFSPPAAWSVNSWTLAFFILVVSGAIGILLAGELILIRGSNPTHNSNNPVSKSRVRRRGGPAPKGRAPSSGPAFSMPTARQSTAYRLPSRRVASPHSADRQAAENPRSHFSSWGCCAHSPG